MYSVLVLDCKGQVHYHAFLMVTLSLFRHFGPALQSWALWPVVDRAGHRLDGMKRRVALLGWGSLPMGQ